MQIVNLTDYGELVHMQIPVHICTKHRLPTAMHFTHSNTQTCMDSQDSGPGGEASRGYQQATVMFLRALETAQSTDSIAETSKLS